MRTKLSILAVILSACGGGGDGGNCAFIGGTTYTGMETLNGCGYSMQLTETYEFYQSKNSCDITVGTPLESCDGKLSGDTLTWTCPPHNSVTYQQATATFSADLTTFNGSFNWTGTGCSATTTLSNFTKN